MFDIKKGDQEFYIEKNGEKLGTIQYVPEDSNKNGKETITITHTMVSDELKGQGAGQALVEKIVEYARNENKKIIPECSFAKHIIEKNADYKDVLV